MKTKLQYSGDELLLYIRDLEERQINLEKRNKELMLVNQEADGKFWALFENGPIGVAYHEMIYDESGKSYDYRFIDANDSYRELTGIDPKGKTVRQAFPGIENEAFDWIETYGEVARTGKSIRFEQFLQFNQRWYDCVAYQYKPNHFVSAFLEITKRKRAEEALKESELKFRTVADQTFDWVYWQGQDQQIIYMSPACKRITGYEPEEFISNPALLQIIVHPNDFDHFIAYHNHIFLDQNRDEVHELELRVINKEDVIVYISHFSRPIFDENGKYLGRRVSNRDISEKEKMVADLIRAKERAEESDRLKSAFLANMSHEIRTPMNGILGFAELLKEPNLTGDEQKEYIGIIEKSGKRMLNIINDIVNISKVESGQMEVSILETNVNKQIEYLYNFFKPEADQRKLSLFFNQPLSDSEAMIYTDKEKIYAILTNLIKNALKFTDSGFIDFGYRKKDKFLLFFVKDTGPGIREEQKEFIFERFRQGNESLSRSYEGAGLGLTISKAYVEMLGGEIWVESDEVQGSTFYFTIPYHISIKNSLHSKNVVPTVKTKNPKNPDSLGLKILIAEDNEVSAILLAKIVSSFSREVLIVRSGVEAVSTFCHIHDIDLVLMDIKMPIMDGYEATRQIRKMDTKVIIIAQSAFALSGDKEKAILSGCDDYITKPITKKHLTELIDKYFKIKINQHTNCPLKKVFS